MNSCLCSKICDWLTEPQAGALAPGRSMLWEADILKPCLTLFPGNPDFRSRRMQASKRKRKEDILILRAMTLNCFDLTHSEKHIL